jgi:hypothetical protein
MSDAAVVRFETLLTQALFDLQEGRSLKREQWDVLGRALNTAVGNRVKVETLRLAADEAQRDAARTTKGGKRLDGVALSDKVRRILGVPLPGEAAPALPPPSTPSPGGAQECSPRREPRDHDPENNGAP